MNPLSHIKRDKFNELSTSELREVIDAYVDQNNYDKRAPNTQGKQALINWFENTYYSISVLISFFKYWKN